MKFKIHWLHGEEQIVEGATAAEAFNNAGIGAGALPAVDYYEEIKVGEDKE